MGYSALCKLSELFFVAPTNSVSGLTLQPSKNNITVSWEAADLSPPKGPVSLYEVEYKDGKEGLSNKVHVRPELSYVVILGVENSDNYEVSTATL